MGIERRMILAMIAILAMAAASACGRDEAGGIREPSAAAGNSKLAAMDEDVLKAMAEPKEPGRIIYEAPQDLSYESARLKRPDLVRPDTSKRADPARAAAPKDTARGEEAAKPGTGGSRRDTTRQRP